MRGIEAWVEQARVRAGSAAIARSPNWSVFDEAWYVTRYPEVAHRVESGLIAHAEEHYLRMGRELAYSPNRFFDEEWYLSVNPEVLRGIRRGEWQSGFDHYIQIGHQTLSPHWLFNEAEYRKRYPEFSRAVLTGLGFWNLYDHYLAGGEEGYRSGHIFFDPAVFAACAGLSEEDALFEKFFDFSNGLADTVRASWYFDPIWYLQTYPQVAAEIQRGTYRCALHHYLTNETPAAFSPQAIFSEEFYLESYGDVAGCVGAGQFRNGYEHFLQAGAREGRQPMMGCDLNGYAALPAVRADIESGLFHDPFAHFSRWIENVSLELASGSSETLTKVQTKALFLREAQTMLPSLVMQRLSFVVTGTPALSVILVMYNQFALTMMTLASLRANFPGDIELILIDSGSRDLSREIEKYIDGARIKRFPYNAGFVEACNAGLDMVTSDTVLYLNNDVRLFPGAIENARARLNSDPTIGAVGAKIIRTNGLLQEAGSIIWWDGRTLGYLRDHDPNCPEANFVRDVDYCSACFLLASTEIARKLNGFDVAYRPAYFEDTDFCVRLILAGYRVVYDPSVVIEHLEYGSSGTESSAAMMQRNWHIFRERQADFLSRQIHAEPHHIILARSRPSSRKRVLFLEDRIPLRELGSGYVRSNDIVTSMARLGYDVTVFPIASHFHSLATLYAALPDMVEILFDRNFAGLASFIQERGKTFDIVWVGRTHNLARILPVLEEMRDCLPARGLILDSEVVATPRRAMRDHVMGQPMIDAAALDAALVAEFECARICQQVVAVSEVEAAMIRRAGPPNIQVLGHSLLASPTPRSFAARRGLLFLGALHDEDSPNLDSLHWFVENVLPLLEDVLPADARFTIAGYRNPDLDVSALFDHPRIDMLGAVEDLAPLFDRHRVFVAPTRFAGGIPYKVHESAAFGLPVVASDVLIDELGWTAGDDLLSGGAPDAAQCAAAITQLYHDEALWTQLRHYALTRIDIECSPARFGASLGRILKAAIA